MHGTRPKSADRGVNEIDSYLDNLTTGPHEPQVVSSSRLSDSSMETLTRPIDVDIFLTFLMDLDDYQVARPILRVCKSSPDGVQRYSIIRRETKVEFLPSLWLLEEKSYT